MIIGEGRQERGGAGKFFFSVFMIALLCQTIIQSLISCPRAYALCMQVVSFKIAKVFRLIAGDLHI